MPNVPDAEGLTKSYSNRLNGTTIPQNTVRTNSIEQRKTFESSWIVLACAVQGASLLLHLLHPNRDRRKQLLIAHETYEGHERQSAKMCKYIRQPSWGSAPEDTTI